MPEVAPLSCRSICSNSATGMAGHTAAILITALEKKDSDHRCGEL